METLNINWSRMNADSFYLGRTPKNLICFLIDMINKNQEERHLSVIDRNEYFIKRYTDCIKIKMVNSASVVKLWFIMLNNLNKCWKEI